MNLFFRLLKTVLLYLFNPYRRNVFTESVVHFRVWPNDLDTNLHVNNGRYLTLLDLGRLDLLLHLGAAPIILKRRWNPVLASLQVRFRRPLNLFQKFEIHTRIVSWDSKWIFLEQKIMRQNDLVMHAFLKGIFVGPNGSVPITEVLAIIGIKEEPPPLPPALAVWMEAEAKIAQSAKGGV